ncbi:hypothetical protein JRO89_XS04G0155200 [Xanthoceras sorbifolium]|uniref:RNase H type-1 domain-containing protein n=1 Tax=Xanthoceras sorbifolium TaxID=99658 RepID=A0ABQ8I5E7_9ROSI|nr:hypothetical protein JRO89_XS04G0155200 [Xanthoceras sorbifolium]
MRCGGALRQKMCGVFLGFGIGLRELEQVCMLLWGIWTLHNSVLHGGLEKSIDSCLIPPPMGTLKMNTDVAIRANCLAIGVGVAIRNSEGLLVAALAKQLPGRS